MAALSYMKKLKYEETKFKVLKSSHFYNWKIKLIISI